LPFKKIWFEHHENLTFSAVCLLKESKLYFFANKHLLIKFKDSLGDWISAL